MYHVCMGCYYIWSLYIGYCRLYKGIRGFVVVLLPSLYITPCMHVPTTIYVYVFVRVKLNIIDSVWAADCTVHCAF